MIRRATKYAQDGTVIDTQDFAFSEARAMYAWAADGDYHTFNFDEIDESELTEVWCYRIIGYASNGSVVDTFSVSGLRDPYDVESMKRIAEAHEKMMAFSGVQTASTVGPMREARR